MPIDDSVAEAARSQDAMANLDWRTSVRRINQCLSIIVILDEQAATQGRAWQAPARLWRRHGLLRGYGVLVVLLLSEGSCAGLRAGYAS